MSLCLLTLWNHFPTTTFGNFTGLMTRKSQHPAVPDAQRGVIRAGDANHLLEVLSVLFLFMEGFWLSDHIAQYRKKRSSTNSQPASGIHPSSSFHEKIGILK